MVTVREKSQDQKISELALKYSYNEKHALLVEKAALKIFDSLESIHRLGSQGRVILGHASLLHDIGSFINEKKHHKHSKYIVDTDEKLSDYPEPERNFVSLIVFNHRKKVHRDTYALPKKDRDMVLKLSAILRIADSLQYTGQEVTVKGVQTQNSAVEISIEGVLPERLFKRLTRKKGLFGEAFGMDAVLKV